MSVFKPEPTCRDFMLSQAYASLIAGPIGSAKSVTAVHQLLSLSSRQNPNHQGLRKTRALIVRNTADQLALTTRKTVFDWLPPGQAGFWKAQEKTYVIQARLPDGTAIESEWLFIALDTPDDVRKALSLEATFLWGNEARELHPEVVDGLLGRLNRYPSMRDGGPTRSCAIFDTNMPDEDTPWFETMEQPPQTWRIFKQPPAIITPEEYKLHHGNEPVTITSITGEKWIIDPTQPMFDKDGRAWLVNPRAENLPNLKSDYYANLIPGKSDDWLRVYLRAVYGRSLSGTPVYEKSFVPGFHDTDEELLHVRGSVHPIVIGLDFGRSPAAVFKQRDPRGRVLTLGEITTENMGLDRFLKTELLPSLQRFQGCSFLVAPDPAGYAKQQANEMTLVDQVRAAGLPVAEFHQLTNDPAKRIAAVERLLNMQVDGKAMYLVDRNKCPTLVKGFRYGYRYKIKRTGDMEDKPDKNSFSHVHDANQYADLVIDLGVRGVSMHSSAVPVTRVRWAA